MSEIQCLSLYVCTLSRLMWLLSELFVTKLGHYSGHETLDNMYHGTATYFQTSLDQKILIAPIFLCFHHMVPFFIFLTMVCKIPTHYKGPM